MIWRVSPSGRTCGRPRQRLPSEAALAVSWAASWQAGDCWWGVILAMLLHDACHSIDSPNVGAILENIKFPNLAQSSPLGQVHRFRASEATRSNRHDPPNHRLQIGRASCSERDDKHKN